MRWGALVLVLAACGRVSFEPLETDAITDGATVLPAIDAAVDATPLACTLDNFACASTPELLVCGDMCFAVCNEGMAMQPARDVCIDWGGDLGRTDSQAHLDCLPGITNDAWLGLIQAANSTTPEGGWSWTWGGPVGFTAWLPNEPEDGDGTEDGSEQCAIFSGGGGWLDDGCTAQKRVLCARPAP